MRKRAANVRRSPLTTGYGTHFIAGRAVAPPGAVLQVAIQVVTSVVLLIALSQAIATASIVSLCEGHATTVPAGSAAVFRPKPIVLFRGREMRCTI